ncbi:probable polyol transporter 3 isoform X1 [Chenopodium quinoa]|uniref:Major facilitator superfamily (MFS) profile domain-containing protein n=1 Tax=Chenopodium quinoa TaxID=63459 RepID=A0A803KVW7_CHEQI|nr:probable polyol transporter 3 isoform X1 [Chenopodium quinoa]
MEEAIAEGEQHKHLNKFACAAAIIASIISVIFGYDTGVMSGAMIFIKEDLKINDTQIEVLAGILNLCALVGSLIAGRTSDYIGRRYTIVVASTLFLLGSILMGYGTNYAVLMTGRCIARFGVGFALMIAPIYTAEISSATHRGKLSSLPEFCISLGILLGYVSNYLFGKLTLKLGWRLMLGVAAIPSLGLIFGVLKMPESPRWLVVKGRIEDAKRVLMLVSNSKYEAEIRLEDIITTVESTKLLDKKSQTEFSLWKELLFKPTLAVRWTLFAAICIHFFEHATGVEAVILYSPRIFKAVGITSKNKLLLANVGLGVVKTLFILVATFLLDKVGRRPLLLTSTAGVIAALIALGEKFCRLPIVANSKNHASWALALSICATYIYMAFFSIGISPITWVYTSEIFPLKFRAVGAGLAVAVNRSMNAAVSMSFISMYKAITIGGTFFLFGGLAIMAWLFFYFFLPETKGKSLEEIEMMFSKKTQPINEDHFVELTNKK